ncbi:hypothetical protein FS749_003560 [Ceratobasidium sp. UAMH 11750]|nr:hypothetical protein FS749_003560 [Ceratobasidium sp. UAMH 11750]
MAAPDSDPSVKLLPMRREAEYWYHRSCFTVHRPCTQDDRDATIALLESLPTDVASRTYVRDHLDNLHQMDTSNITPHEASTIAQIRADTLKMSLPEMQDPRRSTMLKAFHGLKQFKTKWFYHPSVHGNSPAGSPRGSQADN